VLRFRLRKMVPFDVEHAGLSYQVLTESRDEIKVLAAVIPGPILAEYEDVARQAGYEPGAVLPSSLAALAGVDSMEAVLAANLSGLALTTVIANGNDLLLYRTVELPENPELRVEEVRRGIAVASAYFEDKLLARPRLLHYSGDGGADEFALWLDDPELSVIDLAPRPAAGAATALGYASLAGSTGALAGAV
jgi:type IV pilus assembly protein PilM